MAPTPEDTSRPVPDRTAWNSMILPVASLWHREVIRFVRQRGRILGALATPAVLWVLIGSGLHRSFRLPDTADSMDYLEYSFPGMMALVVLFTAIFSMFSVIEDRREGFLQAVLAAPVRRWTIVLGKVLGSSTLATGQALLFLLAAPLADIRLSIVSVLLSTVVLVILSIGVSALGFVIAWYLDSAQGFHAIINLVLIPLWLMSGAFFPVSGAAGWVRWMVHANPLSYGVGALRQALYWGQPTTCGHGPSLPVSLLIATAFAIVLIGVATKVVQKN